MTRATTPAAEAALSLLTEFIRGGVTDLVLAPGSRSQALALAAVALERAGRLRVQVRIDERSASFLALGIAIEQRRPVLVLTTSGTAVANLHPAVLEAHHSGVGLIVLSADRPEELRGIGSNQTTRQAHLFGQAIRLSEDVDTATLDGAAAAALVGRVLAAAQGTAPAAPGTAARRPDAPAGPGPVQLNLAFREPLSGPLPAAEEVAVDSAEQPAPSETPADEVGAAATGGGILRLAPEPGTLVVAGTGAGPEAEALAHALHAPLLAEVTSGAHYGPNLIVVYRQLLALPELRERVRRVVVLGHPTLSREVPALIQQEGVETIVVHRGRAERYNPGHRVQRFASVVTADEAAPELRAELHAWLGDWVVPSRQWLLDSAADAPAPDLAAMQEQNRFAYARYARAELEAIRAEVSREVLVQAVWRATWPHDRLVFGASRLVRVADSLLPGKKVPVHANRGLAGIDGTVATGIGIALASQAGGGRGVTRVLLGDLALLHDAGSLLIGPDEVRPRIQLVVGNDHGGSLFSLLEVAETADADDFRRVLRTPQQVGLQALAEAYGWEYRRAGNRGELDQVLTAPVEGPVLIEVPLPD